MGNSTAASPTTAERSSRHGAPGRIRLGVGRPRAPCRPTTARREYWAYGGDFGDEPNDANFCGTAWSGRTEHRTRRCSSSSTCPNRCVSSPSTRPPAASRRQPSGLRRPHLTARHMGDHADGAVVGKGMLPELRVAPARRPTVGSTCRPGRRRERLVNFRFSLRRATDWAPAGHEVAWEQVALPSRQDRPRAARGARPREGGGVVVVLESRSTRAAIIAQAWPADGAEPERPPRPSRGSLAPALARPHGQRRPPVTARA